MTGVAKLYQTTLTPTKLELLQRWLPEQEWFDDDPGELTTIASYRFVDPEGEVGIESFLLRGKKVIWHIPLTYRPAPTNDATLIGTLTHGVLGERWVYFGPTDDLYRGIITATIIYQGTEADPSDGREKTARALGSGVTHGQLAYDLATALRIDQPVDGIGTLTVSWGSDDDHHAVMNALREEYP